VREGRTEEALEFAQEYLAPRGEEHPALLGELGARPARPADPTRPRRPAAQGMRSVRAAVAKLGARSWRPCGRGLTARACSSALR